MHPPCPGVSGTFLSPWGWLPAPVWAARRWPNAREATAIPRIAPIIRRAWAKRRDISGHRRVVAIRHRLSRDAWIAGRFGRLASTLNQSSYQTSNMSIANTFSRPAKFDVEVFGDTGLHLGHANLEVGGKSGASLAFRLTTSSPALEDDLTFDRLFARSSDGQAFTLFHCRFHSYRAYIGQVVEGETTDAFTEVSVRFTNLTEWFLSGQWVRGDAGDSLAWEGRPDAIDVEVETPHGALRVRSTVETSMRHSGDDTVITDQVWLSVGAEIPFSIADARERCRDLSIFLTILLAQPVDILEVKVGSATGQQRHAWVQYFEPHPSDGERRGWPRFLMRRPLVDGQWKRLLDNYHQSIFRAISWTRMAGMLRYQGFWDFRFFGYVALLDGVVKLKAGDAGTEVIGPPREAVHALRKTLATMAEPLSRGQKAEVVALIRKAFTREVESFGGRYRQAVAASDQGVIGAINITPQEFKVIKETRDAIAHGDNMALSPQASGDMQMLTNKVALMLTYWAWEDFGLTATDFLDCLHQTQNPMVMGADIDRVALDRARRHAEFHMFTESAFDRLPVSKGQVLHQCFTQVPGEGIEYSESFSAVLKTLMRQGKLAPEQLAEAIGVLPDKVRISGPAYIECRSRVVELVWVYIIEMGENDASSRGLREETNESP